MARPGGGRTTQRFVHLAALAGEDLSLGRLAEGHADALAILAEAGLTADPAAVYAVWAARSGDATLEAEADPDGWTLHGAKAFCSGAGACSRVLVTADAPDGYRLFEVELGQPGVQPLLGSWPAVGMQGSDSLTVRFHSVRVGAAAAIGAPGYYLDRPGFWHGAVGVAACWWGGARALTARTATMMATGTAGDAELAELGQAVATVDTLETVLTQAAESIDADPDDLKGTARHRALTVRHAVHGGCLRVIGHVSAAGGARPLSLDGEQSRRVADLVVYLAQHRPGRDAAELGRAALGASQAAPTGSAPTGSAPTGSAPTGSAPQ